MPEVQGSGQASMNRKNVYNGLWCKSLMWWKVEVLKREFEERISMCIYLHNHLYSWSLKNQLIYYRRFINPDILKNVFFTYAWIVQVSDKNIYYTFKLG